MTDESMSFNENELRKIRRATSGWFKKRARRAVADALMELKPYIDAIKTLPDDDQRILELKRLTMKATHARHDALSAGARSYRHPEWAAAAACETWLHELVMGTPDSIARVESLIDDLILAG